MGEAQPARKMSIAMATRGKTFQHCIDHPLNWAKVEMSADPCGGRMKCESNSYADNDCARSIEKSVYAWSMREVELSPIDHIRYKLYRFQYRTQCFFSFCMILSVQASRIAEPRKVI